MGRMRSFDLSHLPLDPLPLCPKDCPSVPISIRAFSSSSVCFTCTKPPSPNSPFKCFKSQQMQGTRTRSISPMKQPSAGARSLQRKKTAPDTPLLMVHNPPRRARHSLQSSPPDHPRMSKFSHIPVQRNRPRSPVTAGEKSAAYSRSGPPVKSWMQFSLFLR